MKWKRTLYKYRRRKLKKVILAATLRSGVKRYLLGSSCFGPWFVFDNDKQFPTDIVPVNSQDNATGSASEEINALHLFNILRLISMWMKLMKQNFQMYTLWVYWIWTSKIICALSTNCKFGVKDGSIDMVVASGYLWPKLFERNLFPDSF